MLNINNDNLDKNNSENIKSNNLNTIKKLDSTTKIEKKEEHSLQYCIDIIQREVKEDNKLVKQIIVIMLSAYSNDPLNLAINAPSGEGKSYNLTKVGNLFPKEDILFISGMTEKALFHRKGILVIKDECGNYISIEDKINEIDEQIENKEYELSQTNDKNLKQGLRSLIVSLKVDKKNLQKNAMKLIDLQHKILVFLDTPKAELLSAIMTLLSHDQFEVEYEFVDTHNGIKTRNNVLRGWPVVIFAQAIDYSHHPRWPEIQRRFPITNPTMSKIKYEKAIDLIGDKIGLPDFVYQQKIVSDEEKEKAREILCQIKENMLDISYKFSPGKNSIIIPFSKTVTDSLPKENASDITFVYRVLGLLKLITLTKVEKRPYIQIVKRGDTKIQKYPFALFEDLSESLYLMENSDTGIRPYVLDWYYDIFLELYNSKREPDSKINSKGEDLVEYKIAVTTEQLVTTTIKKQNKSYTKKQLLDSYIHPLINSGYVDKCESIIDRRNNIYYPIVTIEKNKKLFEIEESNNFLQKRKLIIKNNILFPSKEYIIFKIQEILKYSESINGFIKIFNHKGNEVYDVEELVNKYYDNPHEYFKLDNDKSKNENNGKNNKYDDNGISKNCRNCTNLTNDIRSINFTKENNSLINDKVSEYFEKSKILDNLHENNNNDINIIDNNGKESNILFQKSKSNNFLFTEKKFDDIQINNIFKCIYCNKKYQIEEELVKHSLNKHHGQVAQPDKHLLELIGLDEKVRTTRTSNLVDGYMEEGVS